MTSFILKLIAITAMLIDHIGAIFLSSDTTLYCIFRGIGRIAFPIFVFLIVEGFHHTRNIKRYLLRLGVFALISELPFDIAFYHLHYGTSIVKDFNMVRESVAFSGLLESKSLLIFIKRLMYSQNVFFTLFLGLLLITLIHKLELKYRKDSIIGNVFQALLAIAFCILAIFLKTDYSYAGIMLIAAFYLFRENNLLKTLALLFVTGYIMTKGVITIAIFATLAMLFIARYNGKKGKDMKYLFYIFYPAHLLILFYIYYFIK